MPFPEGLWFGEEEDPGVWGNWPDEVFRPEPDDPESPKPDAVGAAPDDGEKARRPNSPTLTKRRPGTRYRPRKRLRILRGTYLRRNKQLNRPTQTMSTKCQ
jgi:hypothetical protein